MEINISCILLRKLQKFDHGLLLNIMVDAQNKAACGWQQAVIGAGGRQGVASGGSRQ
jgi:hypothetical protein